MKVPEGWKRAPVLAHGEVLGGRQLSPEKLKGIQFPYLRVANVHDGRLELSDVKQMTFSDRELPIFRLQSHDILLNEGQSEELVGRCAMYSGEIRDCCFQNTLVRFRASQNTDPRFAFYLFQWCHYDGVFKAISKRTTSIAHLGTSRFANLVLLWPPKNEQIEIINTLTIWDSAIEKTERLIEAKERLFQASLRHVIRPAGARGNGPISLGEVFRERNETGLHVLPLLSITREEGVVRHDSTGRKDNSNEDKGKYLRIFPGDIGYNTMRMWQGVSALSSLEGIVSPAYTICVPDTTKIDPRFAMYLFKHPKMVHEFYRHSQGLTSDTWNLKFHHFSQIKVSLPPMEEQKRLVVTLDECRVEIALLKKLLKAYRVQKQALMQKLLTGQWRVGESSLKGEERRVK